MTPLNSQVSHVVFIFKVLKSIKKAFLNLNLFYLIFTYYLIILLYQNSWGLSYPCVPYSSYCGRIQRASACLTLQSAHEKAFGWEVDFGLYETVSIPAFNSLFAVTEKNTSHEGCFWKERIDWLVVLLNYRFLPVIIIMILLYKDH